MLLLSKLNEYGRRHDLASNFAPKTIHHVVELTAAGVFAGMASCGKRDKMSAPMSNGRSSGIAPEFFWDNAEYVFGIGSGPKVAARHASFLALAEKVSVETRDKGASALVMFLRAGKWPVEVERAAVEEDVRFTFKMKGDDCPLYDRPLLRAAWDTRCGSDEEPSAFCRVTGEWCVPARLHPTISNMPGSKGAKLVAFNQQTTQFEGRTQGDNFEVGRDVAKRYGAALNHLLEPTATRRHRSAIEIGQDTTMVLFTMDGRPLEPLLNVLDLPFQKPEIVDGARVEPAELRKESMTRNWANLESWRTDPEPCYAVLLRGNLTRIMVLDWFELPLSVFARRLEAWRQDIASEHLCLRAALRLLENPGGKDSALALPILRAVIRGEPFPAALLRSKSHVWVTAAQRRNFGKEPVMSVDTNHPSEAYHRGRLCALICRMQYAAVKADNLVALVNTAMRYPERGFNTLNEKLNFFEHTLRKKGKYDFAREQEEIYSHLSPSFPKEHTRSERIEFQNGFKQQRFAYVRASMEAKAEIDRKKDLAAKGEGSANAGT
ncbi:MAG TPA: type I-C CRISPR-associated protein Cas8c/Csd1 [Thermoanaerobaculia bacterium]|jgi:CRISPR-associated protein Csd1|nr:type I-C CRISPR-associated protein Cas8c/Csd1 [Thermoanaerobaculia bacterium]